MSSHDDRNSELNEINSITEVFIDPGLRNGFMLGELVVFPERGIVVKNSEQHHISTNSMEVLIALSSNPGAILSRQALLGYVWGDKHAASSNLTRAITELRLVFSDRKECPTFIQTLPGKGYRIILPVELFVEDMISADLKSLAAQLHDKPQSFRGTQKRSLGQWRHSHLFKVAGTYIVMAWILMQVVSVTLPIINAPKWLDKLGLLILIVGFPLVLLYNWWTELTIRLSYVKQQKNEKARYQITRRAYRDLIYISLLGIICIGTSFFLTKQILTAPASISDNQASMLQAEVFDNAVAILPFRTMGEIDEEYIIDGLQSELMAFLSQAAQLRVIAERVVNVLPQDASLSIIRKRTGARYVLEGIVRVLNAKISITTTLTDTGSGYQVWANKTDADFTNHLSLHENLSRQVFNALTFLMPQDESKSVKFKPTDDFRAYDLYVQAKATLKDAYTEQQLKKAEQLFLQALARDSNFELAEAGLCQTYLEEYDLLKINQIFELARQSCQKAIDGENVKAESGIALGTLYFESGEYDLAGQQFKQAIVLQPNNSLALGGQADVLARTDKHQQAEELYLAAIRAEPGYWRNYQRYGGFLFSNGRYFEASLQYDKQTILQPGSEEAFSNLGAAHYLNSEFNKATEGWLSALAIKSSANLYSNLGTSLFFSKKFAEAAEMYRQAVAFNKGDFVLKGNLGDALKYVKNQQENSKKLFLEAFEQAKELEKVNPNDLSIKANLARYSSELNQCQQAQPYIQEILTSNPEEPYIFYDLALTANNCGDQASTIEFLKKTLTLGYPKKLLSKDHQFKAYLPYIQKWQAE
jgi:DNA-binding winged helix-turn-helix (wHTH) protein/TolB-like protein/Tfp pilus assembly protein PilF